MTTTRIPTALARMATGRIALRKAHGLLFSKLLGTGSAATFSVRDADLHHWAVLAVWDDHADARVFEHGSLVTAWDRSSVEKARFLLEPISSRGSWGGRNPFEPLVDRAPTGPVAAITRARIKPRLWPRFSRAVPPVAKAAQEAKGLRLSTGIGEAPIGLQGTFSVWESNADLVRFARGSAHSEVVDATEKVGWYSEELFARFTVIQAQGSFNGKPVESGQIS